MLATECQVLLLVRKVTHMLIVFQIQTYCTIYLLDQTHVKLRTSNPLKF